jgi:hypothetical protein
MSMLEGSHSGLVRRPGKSVSPKGLREFESLTLRKITSLYQATIFCESADTYFLSASAFGRHSTFVRI